MTPPAHVVDRIKRFDKRVSIRWSGDRWGVYYRKNDGRDERIGSVHPELLGDGTALIDKLYHTDIYRHHKNAAGAAAFLDRQERDDLQKQREKRKEEFTEGAREEYDMMARLTGRRVNNAGIPTG